MDEKLIREMIEAKRSEASQLGISGKAQAIAYHLGECFNKRHGYLYTYENEKLKISYDSWGPNLQIHWDGKYVFSTSCSGGISTYRSDILGWTEKIQKLYKEIIIPIKEKRNLEKEEERKQELKRVWGIII